MIGQTLPPVTALPVATTPHLPTRSPPEVRTVERSAETTRVRPEGGPPHGVHQPSLQNLVRSAQAFANVLAHTGNVYVASTVSGFRVPLDVYA
ncbi:MAG: hypothetical protein IPM18_01335 [Phycisphaerales bacterium]|nr:hypothetical protein [Phycisphaerales bacterium]